MSYINERLTCSLLLSVLALSGASAAEHILTPLTPSPQTVHVGYFSATLKPDDVTSTSVRLTPSTVTEPLETM